MKSFKQYASSQSEEKDTNKRAEVQTDAERLTQKLADAYNGKSSADMLLQILSEAEKSKRAGTLSNEEIETFYQTFSPMLEKQQQRMLRMIVDKLKEI
jgi:DNA replication protein DnaD